MFTETHKALLVAELQTERYSGLTESQAFDRLHAPQPILETHPVPITVSGIMSLCGIATIERMSGLPYLRAVRDDIVSQDRDAVMVWAGFLSVAGVLEGEEPSLIIGACQATEERQVGEKVPRVAEAFEGVEGFPNAIEPADFAAAWTEANNVPA